MSDAVSIFHPVILASLCLTHVFLEKEIMSPTQALLLLIKPRASRSFLVISPSLYRQLWQLVPTIPSLPVPIRFGSLFHWLLSSYLLSSATTTKLNDSAATDQSYHTPPLRSKHPIRGTVKQLPDQATADSKESGLETGIIVAAMSDLPYQPSSSEEEELEYESYELPKAKDGIQIHEVTLNHHHLGDCTDLEVGTLICNGETIELHDGSFLKITELRKSRNGYSVTFEGYLFRPVEDLEQYLPATFGGNEVVWLCEAKEHDLKPEGYLRSASSKDVLRIRKDRFGDVLTPNTSGNRIAKATCNSARRKSSYHLEHHMLGTSSAHPKVLEHDFEPSNYTFADGFCGAGGTSVGARDAGLEIKWAFDHDGDAIDTYALNHGRVRNLQISARKFLEEAEVADGKSYVDVLHLSPPCQGFALAALACRVSPQSGEINNKGMTYGDAIVKKVKPRIVTFEEVPQVLFRHREYSTIVRNLTSIGYNIRWRTIECLDFGVPQKRKRLFVIASW